jgi:antitoxin (DNA-binding transcriptional repressor) of toxin-antitoxin stability system
MNPRVINSKIIALPSLLNHLDIRPNLNSVTDHTGIGPAVYNPFMAKDVIHISEAEAASDFASLLERVRAGAEVVIENDARPVAVLRSAETHPGRLLSESIALAEAHGSTVTLDGDFGRDLEEIINSHREPLNPPAWD